MNVEDWVSVPVINDSYDFRKSKLKEIEACLAFADDGPIAEFGTWKGYSINHIANLVGDSRDVYGFDSCIGLPEDFDLGDIKIKKNFNWDGFHLDERIKFYKGWFVDTIPKFKNDLNNDISFLNVDCDVYSSTVDILTMLNDRIVSGTIIRFDELACWRTIFNENIDVSTTWLKGKPMPFYKNWKDGEWKALNEWLVNFDRKVSPLCRTWHISGCVIVDK